MSQRKATAEQGQRAKEGKRRASRREEVGTGAGATEKVRCEPDRDGEECERRVPWRL